MADLKKFIAPACGTIRRLFQMSRLRGAASLVVVLGVIGVGERPLHGAESAEIASLCASLREVDTQLDAIASNADMHEFLKGKGDKYSNANRLWADVQAAGIASNKHRRRRVNWYENTCARAWNMDPDPSRRIWPQGCKEYMEKDEQLLDRYNKARKKYETYMDGVISEDAELGEISISNYAQFKSSWAQWDKTYKADLARKPRLEAQRNRLGARVKSLEASCP